MKIYQKYHIGVDFAYKPSWWKRILVWLRIKKQDWDYSCMILWKKDKNGIINIKDIRYF